MLCKLVNLFIHVHLLPFFPFIYFSKTKLWNIFMISFLSYDTKLDVGNLWPFFSLFSRQILSLFSSQKSITEYVVSATVLRMILSLWFWSIFVEKIVIIVWNLFIGVPVNSSSFPTFSLDMPGDAVLCQFFQWYWQQHCQRDMG